MQKSLPNHYATLGLDRKCTTEQIRTAYRILAKQFHPDINPNVAEAHAQTQALNLAYETLIDADQRKAYDRELACGEKAIRSKFSKTERNIAEEVHIRIEDFLRGTTREVRINDPGNPSGPEVYELVVPPETAPGSRIRVARDDGGFITIRLRPLASFQFKVRGSDLRCDLKTNFKRAAQGGEELVAGVSGNRIRVKIPAGVARGEIIRIAGEGLPRPRGGRGDLLVRIMYQPEVRITRSAR